MLSRSARAVLNTALRKYRPGRIDLIPVGGIAQLKPALRLMRYRRGVDLDAGWKANRGQSGASIMHSARGRSPLP
jgi:hypothetical protein